MIWQTCNLQNDVSGRGRGADFRKKRQTNRKCIVYSHQTIDQRALAVKKLQNCNCDQCCRFTDRALEAKIAQVTSENQNCDGRLKRNKDEPSGQKSGKCQKDGSMKPYLRHSSFQNLDFWRPIAQSWFSKLCFLLERGVHFCQKLCKTWQHFCKR